MSNKPAPPLVGPEVDLRNFLFMPIDVVRLRDSGIAVCTTGDEFRAAVLLWCAAWHQLPAASLPNDDASLAQFTGYGRDIKGWKKIKRGAMRGWVKCNDGRLYHPVVAEKAIESWKKKQEQRSRTLKARIAAIEKKEKEAGSPAEKQHLQDLLLTLRPELSLLMTRSVTESVTDNATEPVTESKGQVRDSKGKGQVRDIYKNTHTVGLAPDGACSSVKTNDPQLRQRAIALLEFLNQKCGKNMKPEPAIIKPIVARLGEGATDDACRQIIVRKHRQWGNDKKRREWLRPKTLFGEENFWNYHGELVSGDTK